MLCNSDVIRDMHGSGSTDIDLNETSVDADNPTHSLRCLYSSLFPACDFLSKVHTSAAIIHSAVELAL